MRDIDVLLKKLIPPTGYQNRNDFYNEDLVLSLTEEERIEVERNLIEILKKKEDDLVGEILVTMKSTKSLSILKKKLNLCNDSLMKIIWASFINEIKGGDEEMKLIVLNEIKGVTNTYAITLMFYYLSRFSDSRINEEIKKFIDHTDYLIANNAKRSLGIEAL